MTRCTRADPSSRPRRAGGLIGLALLLSLLLLGAGAAGAEEHGGGAAAPIAEDDDLAFEEDDELGFDEESEEELFYDPWEKSNRAVFAFNEGLNRMVAEPVSRAWAFTVPEFLRIGMRNFFVNIAFPIRVLNTTLQAKPVATVQEVSRFAINSTFGLAGLVDVAGNGCNIPIHREDFGQTLGFWGVPNGPYIMLPLFGPSTVRDTVGLAGDVTTGAVTFSAIGVSVPFFATFAAQAGNFINSQSFVVDEVAMERKNSLDFYAAVRSAYLQFRRARVEDYDGTAEEDDEAEDIYYLE